MTEQLLPFESQRECKRRMSNRDRVLARLQSGPASNRELNDICFRYGARILELRRDGFHIDTEYGADGFVLYRLRSSGQAAPFLAAPVIPTAARSGRRHPGN